MIRLSILSIALLATSACASSNQTSTPSSAPGSISATQTGDFIRLSDEAQSALINLNAHVDSVMKLLPEVYKELGITGAGVTVEPPSYGTGSFTGSRIDGRRATDFVRCGNQGSGPSSGGMSRLRLTIRSTARARDDGRTSLETEVTGISTPVEGTSTGPVRCASTGTLEMRIRSMLLEYIGT